jgi:hypothetical protein
MLQIMEQHNAMLPAKAAAIGAVRGRYGIRPQDEEYRGTGAL